MTGDEPRYSLQALVDETGLTEAALGRRIGLSGTTLKQARLRGFAEPAADRYALRAGLLPWNVWTDWGHDHLRTCAARDCTITFHPNPLRAGHRYCNPRCRRREAQRRWQTHRYRTDPDFAAAERARAAAYYAECRTYVRARQQRARAEAIAA